MKERPILFSGPMVRAILDSRKTMTRRVIGTPTEVWQRFADPEKYPDVVRLACKYGQPGDQLWVRETWREEHYTYGAENTPSSKIRYRADTQSHGPVNGQADAESKHWRPSIFMPRWASRITLDVTDVRVERVQDISEEDAEAEGVGGIVPAGSHYDPRDIFYALWDQINAKRGYGWDANPWVWVITFREVRP